MENKIFLTKELMRSIARYETTFNEIIGRSSADEGDIICPEVYSYTLEDLREAVRRLKEADPLIEEFGETWLYPIISLAGAFDLERACGLPVGAFDMEDEDGLPEEDEDWPEDDGLPDGGDGGLPGSEEFRLDDEEDWAETRSEYPGLRTCDSDYFLMIWGELEYAWEEGDGDAHLSGMLRMDLILEDLDRYFANKGKPIPEWEFSDEEKGTYIEYFADDIPDDVSENALALARSFLDELCEKGHPRALHIKGYSCYGGNRLYPCDWVTSRDCMIRLYDLTDDPTYANTLGYIYYYGRCTGGEPEYEKALRCFSVAAANGFYEGAYKLADMFLHGYACKKSPRTARRLYEMVYDDCIKRFLQGEDTNFADAALRMGNVWAKGIDCKPDPVEAYAFYLQADYAARMRAEKNDFFGNKTVVLNAQNALDEAREELPEGFFKDSLESEAPNLFWQICTGNQRVEVSVMHDEDGQVLLGMTRIPTRAVPYPDAVLMTVPELDFCRRGFSAAYYLAPDAETWTLTRSERVRCDYFCVNEAEDRIDFYCDDVMVAWVRSASYRLLASPEGD